MCCTVVISLISFFLSLRTIQYPCQQFAKPCFQLFTVFSCDPEMALSDSVKNTLYMHNPRFASIEMKDVENANYDRILGHGRGNNKRFSKKEIGRIRVS